MAAVAIDAASKLPYASGEERRQAAVAKARRAPAAPRAWNPAHLAMLAAEAVSERAIVLGHHDSWNAPKVFKRAEQRLHAYPDLERWVEVGMLLALERPDCPLGAWELVSHRNFDAWMSRAPHHAHRVRELWHDSLRGPRLVASRLEALAQRRRLLIPEDGLAALGAKDSKALFDAQFTAVAAVGDQRWIDVADWIAAGGIDRFGLPDVLSLSHLQRWAREWLLNAGSWASSGRPGLARASPASSGAAARKDLNTGMTEAQILAAYTGGSTT